MTASIIAILAYLIPFLVDAWKASRPEAAKEARDAIIQKGRLDIATGNVIAVNGRIDGLLSGGSLSAKTAVNTGDIAGLSSDTDTARRLSEITSS